MLKTLLNAKAVIIHNNKALLLRRAANDPVNPDRWSFAGGMLDAGESFEQGVVREAFEETGLRVRPVSVNETFAFPVKEPHTYVVGVSFICEATSTDVKLSHEHSDFKWVALNQSFEEYSKSIQREIRTYLWRKKQPLKTN